MRDTISNVSHFYDLIDIIYGNCFIMLSQIFRTCYQRAIVLC